MLCPGDAGSLWWVGSGEGEVDEVWKGSSHPLLPGCCDFPIYQEALTGFQHLLLCPGLGAGYCEEAAQPGPCPHLPSTGEAVLSTA